MVVRNFILELDFCFKKEITDSPLKLSKMEIKNVIKLDTVEVDLTMSELKLIYDIIDIYIQMVSIASIKNRIVGIILDKEFLKNNILYMNSS